MTKVDTRHPGFHCGKGRANAEGLDHQIEWGMRAQPNLLGDICHKLL
jgi:hypothetical protein